VAIYAGYASAWWPSAPATVTRFSAEPVVVVKHQPSPPTQHTVGDEGDRTAMPTPEGQGGRSSQPASLLAAARTWALSWAQQPINRLRYSEHTLDFTIEFEYTLPDGKTYMGTSSKDANFPSRLDLECPSCMRQAQAIVDFFGKPGKPFLLFYHPQPPRARLTARRAKHNNNKDEGRYPLYCLDSGIVAPWSYEHLAWGTSLVGVGLLETIPRFRTQSWRERLTTQRGMLPVFLVAVASGALAYGTHRWLESRLAIREAQQRERFE